jgi:hypothetical protein
MRLAWGGGSPARRLRLRPADMESDESGSGQRTCYCHVATNLLIHQECGSPRSPCAPPLYPHPHHWSSSSSPPVASSPPPIPPFPATRRHNEGSAQMQGGKRIWRNGSFDSPPPLCELVFGVCWSDHSAAPPPILHMRGRIRRLLETA